MTWMRFYVAAFVVAATATIWLAIENNPLGIITGFTALVLIGCMGEEL